MKIVNSQKNSLALIKITKSPYPNAPNNLAGDSLALIKITKSPYLGVILMIIT